jgi:hypothetical protein
MKISEELSLIKTNYDKTIDLVNGLPFSQKNQIRTIEFYSNSKYLNGQKDELGREKPFMQILNAICDVENTAKDLDTKDINVNSDDGNHYMESFMLSKDIQVWMKESDFGKTLNDMRDIHTRYGSLLVKKCIEKDEETGEKILKLELPEWKNTLTDQVNIIQGAIVETHWMTAVELSKMTEWKDVDKVMEKLKGSGSSKRIPVYEIRGEFSQATLKDCQGLKYTTKDTKTFSYQLYYIAGNPVESGKLDTLETYVPLYWEDDTERVYKYLARKPRAGRAFGVGVFEEGEEAQVWTNDTVLKQYRAMEYTTKVIGQSASKKLKGRNLLTETDDGTILEHEDGKPITALNLLPSGGLNQYSNLIQQWYNQLEKTTSAYSAQRGDTPPSGTPFRLQATVLQQSSSVFKTLQQEMGIFITEIFEDWIMPYLRTRLNKQHILAYEFSPEELKEIDKNFSTRNANDKAIDAILNGVIVTPEQFDAWLQGADTFIKQTKGSRFIDIPKNFYKNLEAKVTINITGEQRNKAATLESLNNILITGMKTGLPQAVMSQVLMKIIELSGAGISPINISTAIAEDAKQNQGKQGALNKVSESMSYKDVPEDVKRQIEAQAGLQPSQGTSQPTSSSPQPKPLSLTAKT